MKRKSRGDLKAHFRKRWAQRVDAEIEAPIEHINGAIRKGGNRLVTPLFSESSTRSHWGIKWGDETFRVVYNKKLNCVVTVLNDQNGGINGRS